MIIALLPVLIALPMTAGAAAMYTEQPLYEQPKPHAAIIATIDKGEVSIVERKGFWVLVKSGSITGWTRLSNVKMKESMHWMKPIDTLHDTGRIQGHGKTL